MSETPEPEMPPGWAHGRRGARPTPDLRTVLRRRVRGPAGLPDLPATGAQPIPRPRVAPGVPPPARAAQPTGAPQPAQPVQQQPRVGRAVRRAARAFQPPPGAAGQWPIGGPPGAPPGGGGGGGGGGGQGGGGSAGPQKIVLQRSALQRAGDVVAGGRILVGGVNGRIIVAVVVIASVGSLRAFLTGRPITRVLVGAVLVVILLSIMDLFGGPFSQLAGDLAMLAMIATLLLELPDVFPALVAKTPAAPAGGGGAHGVK